MNISNIILIIGIISILFLHFIGSNYCIMAYGITGALYIITSIIKKDKDQEYK